MSIGITSRGNFSKTKHRLERLLRGDIYSDLDRYGQMGVAALQASTPVDTGRTAMSWDYRVIRNRKHSGVAWFNTNSAGGTGPSVAILIQYGHGTGTGGYVAGRDFINPTMRPLFDQIAIDVWKKVTS